MKTKKSNKSNNNNSTTFDPKLHYRGKGQSGYGLKKDAETNNHGSQLKHILGIK